MEVIKGIGALLGFMVKILGGLYGFAQATLEDTITVAVIMIIALLVVKKTFDAFGRFGQAAARVADAGASTTNSISDISIVVVLIILVLVGIYKSDGITGITSKFKNGECNIGIQRQEAVVKPMLLNQTPRNKPVAENQDSDDSLDAALYNYYMTKQDSVIASTRPESLFPLPDSTLSEREKMLALIPEAEQGSFWDWFAKANESLENSIGLDGSFRKKN